MHECARRLLVVRLPKFFFVFILSNAQGDRKGKAESKGKIVARTSFISNWAKPAPIQRRLPPPKGINYSKESFNDGFIFNANLYSQRLGD